jgi:hypothetical protein
MAGSHTVALTAPCPGAKDASDTGFHDNMWLSGAGVHGRTNGAQIPPAIKEVVQSPGSASQNKRRIAGLL